VLHRIMAFDCHAAQSSWLQQRHPLYQFIFETEHLDLHVGPAPVLPERLLPRGVLRGQRAFARG
jgi:hypothetical protein